MFATDIAPHFVLGLVLLFTHCSSLDSDGQLSDFHFLLILLECGSNFEVEDVMVCVLVRCDM